MISQELIEWIRNAINSGYSIEQVKQKLIENNYNLEDINEAFNIVLENKNEKEKNVEDNIHVNENYVNEDKKILRNVIAVLIFIGFVIGAMIFFSRGNDFLLKEDKPEIPQINECLNLFQNLKSCTPYVCEFFHPITFQILKREIKGKVDGKCQYVEEMPNNIQISCNYNQNTQNDVAQYYEEKSQNKPITTRIIISEEGIQKTKYVVNGINEDNPIQKAFENEECIILGY